MFLIYAVAFHRTIIRDKAMDEATKSRALTLLYSLYACLTLITVRTSPTYDPRSNHLHETQSDAYHLSNLRVLARLS